ncbi:Fur family transcriptional regulator [Microvirga sp. W0021]|uniref:Ferric uptake regulation protein n=1 Tax=Hohaiivirga grylli TaxID=3133970 RepID=A0ABV0BHY7_9HYPH
MSTSQQALTPVTRTHIPGKIEQACREKGLRMTGPRVTIASILDSADDHPDVFELHRRAALIDEKISLSTVYRILRVLNKEGIIDRIDLNEGPARYEPTTEQPHDHLVNLDTGDFIEFRSKELDKLYNKIARKLGFKLVSHRLELYATPLDGESSNN